MLLISKVETFYGNIQALRGVSVKVNSGEIVTLIGSNGAGKSTLLMTISGVNKASTGEILFDDKRIENLPLLLFCPLLTRNKLLQLLLYHHQL